MASELPHLWACDKTIFSIEFQFQHKRNKQKKKRKRADSQKNLVVFSAGIHSEK